MRKNERQFANQLRRSRIALFSVLVPILPLALAMPGPIQSFLRLAYIVLGFSLIIFLHELGHFLVARACSVKCLAFSIGIGPRMLGWRKGAGLSFGNDPFDPDTKKKDPTPKERLEHTEAATTHSDLPQSAAVPPHPKNVGDTDYRVSWLPLGGYVRMLGQDDMDPTKISDDPRAFNRRPIWQRMCIVSAGVIMNLIFAAVCFSIIFSPGIGVEFPPAIVGQVQYGSPAWGKLNVGDEILSINGEKPRGFLEFTDIAMQAALSTGKDPLNLLVRPYHTHGEADKIVSLIPVHNDATGFLALGIDSLQSMKIAGSSEDYLDAAKDLKDDPADLLRFKKNKDALAKLRKGDEIIAIDGKDVHGEYISMYREIQAKNGAAVTLTLQNKNTALPNQDIQLYPHLEIARGVTEFPPVFGLHPRLQIAEVVKKSAAADAGVMDKDIVLAVGDRSNPTIEEFMSAVGNSGGQQLPLVVQRGTETVPLKVKAKWDGGRWRIGAHLVQDLASLRFAPPAVNTPVDALNLPADATISAIDGQKVDTWLDVYSLLRSKKTTDPVAVTFAPPTGDPITKPLTLAPDEATALTSLVDYKLGLQLENLTRNQHGQNAGEAMLMGMDHTKKFVLQVYMTLAGLFRQTVSADNLHGIVGIAKIGYDVQERGMVWLWYVLAMVSVNLAVANFLPLPIVDGGLFLLLILEKIRGRPLSLKVQSAIQVVGIVLLAGLFLFVTKNDIGMFMK